MRTPPVLLRAPKRILCLLAVSLMITSCRAQFPSGPYLLPPEAGRLYHGVYPGGTSGSEDEVTPERLAAYEEAVGREAAWVTFSHEWSESPEFPTATARWIVRQGKVPYIRLMLRSTSELNRAEETFTLDAILAGRFDRELRAWGEAARALRWPVIVEWGTEANGRWFPWNGVWNGGPGEGPRAFRRAYRHIVRTVAAPNTVWVFHVNAYDDPREPWNALENYYPGDGAVDWLGVSVYGSQRPDENGVRSFDAAMARVVPRLEALAPGKPLFVVEFGSAAGAEVDPGDWAEAALASLLDGRWPSVRGFAWWNEAWPLPGGGSTTMRVQDTPGLAQAFRRQLAASDDLVPPRLVPREDAERLEP